MGRNAKIERPRWPHMSKNAVRGSAVGAKIPRQPNHQRKIGLGRAVASGLYKYNERRLVAACADLHFLARVCHL